MYCVSSYYCGLGQQAAGNLQAINQKFQIVTFLSFQNRGLVKPGLPDFSWSKRTECPQTIPNGHKLYQMAVNIPNGHKIYKHFSF
jgi:hypothetical protein